MMQSGDPIPITEFPGMGNIARQSVIPIVLNMDVTADKMLEKRWGRTLFVALTDSHSLVTDGEYLYAGGKGTASPESIWRISAPGAVKQELTAITGKLHPISYVLQPGKRLFMSSLAWNGIYDYALGSMRAWGADMSDDPAMLDGLGSSERMLTLGVKRAPFMEGITEFAGRIWGIIGKQIAYSEPFAYEWFKDENRLKFPEELTMIAHISPDGFYVGSEKSVWFVSGTNPENVVSMKKVGDGAIKGSLQYWPVSKYGNNIPVWTAPAGIVAGSQGGVVALSDSRVKFKAEGQAAAILRTGGVIAYPTDSSYALGSHASATRPRRGAFGSSAESTTPIT